jgi:hypothetical protein
MATDAKLKAFADALNKETGGGRDMDKARKIADDYVAANRDKFALFEGHDEAFACHMADVFRAAAHDARERGDEAEAARNDEGVALVEIWVRHHFEPQDIGGNARAQVRFLPEGMKG